VTLTASDIMTRDVTTIGSEETVESLIQLFRVSHFTGIPVVDEHGKAVGLVSETDILRAMAYALGPPGSDEMKKPKGPRDKGATTRLLRPFKVPGFDAAMKQLVSRKVLEVMSPVLVSCRPEDPLHLVCETMTWKEVHRIVVTDDDGKVAGLISSLDAVRKLGEVLKPKE
jgi:CBS-domain-containing membrane protein